MGEHLIDRRKAERRLGRRSRWRDDRGARAEQQPEHQKGADSLSGWRGVGWWGMRDQPCSSVSYRAIIYHLVATKLRGRGLGEPLALPSPSLFPQIVVSLCIIP